MYAIHLNAPIIDGFGIVYPVYKANTSSIRPTAVCVGAGSPKAAEMARIKVFITIARVKAKAKKMLRWSQL
jgi:hypothetical protein